MAAAGRTKDKEPLLQTMKDDERERVVPGEKDFSGKEAV